jgi:hypothetical protein
MQMLMVVVTSHHHSRDVGDADMSGLVSSRDPNLVSRSQIHLHGQLLSMVDSNAV